MKKNKLLSRMQTVVSIPQRGTRWCPQGCNVKVRKGQKCPMCGLSGKKK